MAASTRAPAVLLAAWTGPYGGVPPFDRVAEADFEPALEAAMAEQLAELDRIAADPSAPTFENTVAAFEDSGRTLGRVMAVYQVWSGAVNTPAFQAVEREMAPRLAAFADRITQHRALFDRIAAVYDSPALASATPEQRRLAWLHYTSFVRAGARLDGASKQRLTAVNQRLAALFTAFSQNVLADETDRFLTLTAESELAGLPASFRAAAAAAAAARGVSDGWVIENTRSAMDALLTHARRRDVRERAWRLWIGRGDGGDGNDNNAHIAEILALRAERATLLGYATHAHWRLEHTMARTPDRALALLDAVWPPAVARAREEVAAIAALAREDGLTGAIEPWDYRHYAEQVRSVRYEVDEDEVKPYLGLERMLEATFRVAGELFGWTIEPAAEVPVYHEDVRVWAVGERATGRHVGLFYFDPFARAGKRSGAWMSSFRAQERFAGAVTPLVANTCNFVRGRPDEPVLLSWDDATTLFHEFGHALHGLASDVAYPSLSGTAVARDYVEFPSQLFEHWLEAPAVLERFALHDRTGEPIPRGLIERITRAANFDQGFATTEYLASALVELKMHLAGAAPIEPAAFERDVLADYDMPRAIVMRHRPPHFLHVFASDSYSAAYYSYLWADVLSADAFDAFTEGAGAFDRDVAERLRRHVLAAGNTVEPAEAYRAFRGRDADIAALMRKRGLGRVGGGDA